MDPTAWLGTRLIAAVVLWAAGLAGCAADDSSGSGGDAEPADTQPADTAGGDTADTPPDGGLEVDLVDGQAVVSWSAPTTRSDGTELGDDAIGGYRVYWGTASRAYDGSLDVGRASSARIGGLAPGVRYFFAVTAYDVANRESDYSDEVFKDL